MLARNLSICHRCPHRAAPSDGACPCILDGRDIIDHAAEGKCPAGNFDTPATTIVRGALGIAKALLGMDRPARAAIIARLRICKECEYWNPKAGTCLLCGCKIWAKARIAGEQCPLGKWPKE